jgi:hypothetical protein
MTKRLLGIAKKIMARLQMIDFRRPRNFVVSRGGRQSFAITSGGWSPDRKLNKRTDQNAARQGSFPHGLGALFFWSARPVQTRFAAKPA